MRRPSVADESHWFHLPWSAKARHSSVHRRDQSPCQTRYLGYQRLRPMYSQQACSNSQIQHRARQARCQVRLRTLKARGARQERCRGFLLQKSHQQGTPSWCHRQQQADPLQSQHRRHPMSSWPTTARAGYRHRHVTCDVMTDKTWTQRCFVSWKVKWSNSTVFTEGIESASVKRNVWLWFCPRSMFTQRLRKTLVLPRECGPQAPSTTCGFASIGVACSERVACLKNSIATNTSMFSVFFDQRDEVQETLPAAVFIHLLMLPSIGFAFDVRGCATNTSMFSVFLTSVMRCKRRYPQPFSSTF